MVLVVCALAVTGMVARRELLPPPPPPLVTTFYDDWRELTERGHRFGKKAAPVQEVVFSDYQCPYCRSVTPTIEQLLTKYPDEVAVTYRHFLLEDIHPQARDAAITAECAAEQGRFASMHRVLFDSVKTLGKTPWEDLAAIAGVPDRATFSKCMKEPRHNDAIATDLAAVVDVGIGAVPALVINGTLVMGAKSFEVVDDLVQKALAEVKDRR